MNGRSVIPLLLATALASGAHAQSPSPSDPNDDKQFSGIGIAFRTAGRPDRIDHFYISGLIEGGPAERAGVRLAERIVAVDAGPTGTTAEEFAGKLRGPTSTQVIVTLERHGIRRDVSVVRAPIDTKRMKFRSLPGGPGRELRVTRTWGPNDAYTIAQVSWNEDATHYDGAVHGVSFRAEVRDNFVSVSMDEPHLHIQFRPLPDAGASLRLEPTFIKGELVGKDDLSRLLSARFTALDSGGKRCECHVELAAEELARLYLLRVRREAKTEPMPPAKLPRDRGITPPKPNPNQIPEGL